MRAPGRPEFVAVLTGTGEYAYQAEEGYLRHSPARPRRLSAANV